MPFFAYALIALYVVGVPFGYGFSKSIGSGVGSGIFLGLIWPIVLLVFIAIVAVYYVLKLVKTICLSLFNGPIIKSIVRLGEKVGNWADKLPM